MNHAHHEYLFDYRFKDHETGKLNTDKLTTINSQTLPNLIDREFQEYSCAQGRFSSEDNSFQGLEERYNSIKFVEREKELQKLRKKEEIARKEELEIQQRRHKERKEYEERQRIAQEEFEERQKELRLEQFIEMEEYRKRLQQREDELLKERQRNRAKQHHENTRNQNGTYGGQRIITSQWKVK
jgi:hypothetical protein